MVSGVLAAALAVVTSAAGCDRPEADARVDGGSVMSFEAGRVLLVTGTDTVTVHAQIARTGEQKTMGLMERTSLAPDSGMLFVYEADQPPTAGFWMFRTRIPLDIAFADSTGRIVAIRTMQPCTATLAAGCPSYEPGAPYRYALEVNAGFFARRGVGVGSRLYWR
jgi:uncharacterized protein